MEKSFLELLEAEKKAINDVKMFKESIVDFLNQSNRANTKEEKEIYERIAHNYKMKKIKAEDNLLRIRREIKQYISFLETL